MSARGTDARILECSGESAATLNSKSTRSCGRTASCILADLDDDKRLRLLSLLTKVAETSAKR